MAAKRVAKTVVDWAAFAERIPRNQKELYRAFKSRNDMFMNRVHQYPENLPQIDFSFYRSRLVNGAMVEQFEKSYASVSVAYPTDKKNIISDIDKQEEQACKETDEYVGDLKKSIEEATEMIKKIDLLPKPDIMTREMYSYYFPEGAIDPVNKPTFWPHTPSIQPGNLKTLIN